MTNTDFAAAQRRVAARRQAREAAAKARQREQFSVPQNSALGRLPPSLQSVIGVARQNWDAVKGRDGTRPAFRVGQVDAELLDEELLDLLKGQASEALKYFGPHLRDDWSSEISFALRAIIFKLSIWDHDASYGAALQNLRYTDARQGGLVPSPPRRWQKVLYGLLSVGGRYAWDKWEGYLLDIEGGYEEPPEHMKKLSALTSALSTTHTFAATASFLVFLVNGRYRTLLDRLLRLRLTPTTSQVSREVSFEYLNRQLVWHAFTEFLLFLLPLVGITRWRKWVSRAWRKTQAFFRQGSENDDGNVKLGGELHFLPERTCAICYKDLNPASAAQGEVAAMSMASSGVVGSAQTDITNPYEAIPCGCIYCFVCIAQRLDAEDGEGWTCLRCGEMVHECKPWNGDVMEERSRTSSGKSVSFAEDEKFANLEPMPVEDERTAGVAAEIEQDLARNTTQSLESIDGWDDIDATEGESELRDEALANEAFDDSFIASASLVGAPEANADEEEQK